MFLCIQLVYVGRAPSFFGAYYCMFLLSIQKKKKKKKKIILLLTKHEIRYVIPSLIISHAISSQPMWPLRLVFGIPIKKKKGLCLVWYLNHFEPVHPSNFILHVFMCLSKACMCS